MGAQNFLIVAWAISASKPSSSFRRHKRWEIHFVGYLRLICSSKHRENLHEVVVSIALGLWSSGPCVPYICWVRGKALLSHIHTWDLNPTPRVYIPIPVSLRSNRTATSWCVAAIGPGLSIVMHSSRYIFGGWSNFSQDYIRFASGLFSANVPWLFGPGNTAIGLHPL